MTHPAQPSPEWQSSTYWQDLCPGLHVDNKDFFAFFPQLTPDPDTLKSLKDRLDEEAYCSWNQAPWRFDFSALANCLLNLRAANWPPVFCFVYDEFWLLISKMANLVGELLEGPPARLPDIWAWHLDPANAETGWEPHRDKGRHTLFENGKPKSITYWIPLTPATPMNGCLYLLPKSRDPHYNTDKEMKPNVPLMEIRALPSEPGTLWFWNQAVLHWSGRAHPSAKIPRMSVSCEYQRADVQPFKEPLTNPSEAPPLADRLALIRRQLVQYRHMTPLSPQVEAWVLNL